MSALPNLDELPFAEAVAVAMEQLGLSRSEAEEMIKFGHGEIQGCIPGR